MAGFLLPETYRSFSSDLKKVNNDHNWLVSKYTLQVDYRYDGVDRYATKIVSIRLINGSLIMLGAVALAAIIGVIMLLWYIRRRRNAKKILVARKAASKSNPHAKHIDIKVIE